MVGCAKTHPQKEGRHVLPGRCRPMADNHQAASGPVAQAPSHRLGPVELRHGAGPLVCPERRESLVGQGHAAQGADRAAAAARMVGRCAAQARPEAPRRADRDLFSRLAGLGGELVARHAPGPGGPGPGATVCRLGGQCGLAWGRDARRLGGAAGHYYHTCLAAAGTAAAPGPPAR
jgi:hypothetical protein